MNEHNGRLGSRPGIFKISTRKLDVVQMVKAWLLSLSKTKGLRAGYALESDANAAKNKNVNTIAGNGGRVMFIRHGVVSARNA